MIKTIICAVLLLAPPEGAPELTDDNFSHWRDHILPDAEELAWREIPWEISFWDAVTRARSEGKPVLVWAMNGHPLACT